MRIELNENLDATVHDDNGKLLFIWAYDEDVERHFSRRI